jgi:hypothetical protein
MENMAMKKVLFLGVDPKLIDDWMGRQPGEGGSTRSK